MSEIKADQNSQPLEQESRSSNLDLNISDTNSDQDSLMIENTKLASKITSLEKIIDNVNVNHSKTLVGLHSEVDRLSNLVSELMLALATEGKAEGIKKLSKSESIPKFLSDPTSLHSSSISEMYRIMESIHPITQQLLDAQADLASKKEGVDAGIQVDFESKFKNVKMKTRDRATETVPSRVMNHETQTVYSIDANQSIGSSNGCADSAHSTSKILGTGAGSTSPKIKGLESTMAEMNRMGIENADARENSILNEESALVKPLDRLPSPKMEKEVSDMTGQEKESEMNMDHEHDSGKKHHQPHPSHDHHPHQMENSDESIYLLVQKEKKKFHALVERVAEEKKRRQLEIETLKSEMNVLKSVLKLAGLSYDVKDFKDILLAHQEIERVRTPIAIVTNKDILGNAKKALPPINPNVESTLIHPIDDQSGHRDIPYTIQELQQTQNTGFSSAERSGLDHQHKISHNDPSSDLLSENGNFLMDPIPHPPRSPKLAPTSSIQARKLRMKPNSMTPADHAPLSIIATSSKDPASSLKQSTVIPAIMRHNQNLDYQGRAHIYLDNVLVECTEDQMNQIGNPPMNASQTPVHLLAASERSPLLTRVFAKTLQAVKRHHDKDSVLASIGDSENADEQEKQGGRGDPGLDESSKKTHYSGRLWRSKLVRDKVLKSLENKF